MLRPLSLLLLAATLALSNISAADAAAQRKKSKAKPVPQQRQPAPTPFGERADLMAFAAELAQAEGWEAAPLQAQLA